MKPKTLFLIDGIGAAIFVIALGIVSPRFEFFFGIPQNVLFLLAVFPCLFAIYDGYAYTRKTDVRPYLKAIAGANLSYCVLSLVLLFLHLEAVTVWGWLYVLGEILIVSTLAVVQIRVSNQ